MSYLLLLKSYAGLKKKLSPRATAPLIGFLLNVDLTLLDLKLIGWTIKHTNNWATGTKHVIGLFGMLNLIFLLFFIFGICSAMYEIMILKKCDLFSKGTIENTMLLSAYEVLLCLIAEIFITRYISISVACWHTYKCGGAFNLPLGMVIRLHECGIC